MDNWRRLRKHIHKKRGRFTYARVLEIGSKNDRPHLHFAIEAEVVPHAPKIGTSLGSWQQRLTVSAYAFYRLLRRLGLGAYQCKSAFADAGGVVVYLSKYLTKVRAKVIDRPDYRRVRVFETSRDWKRQARLSTWHVTESDFSREDRGEYEWTSVEARCRAVHGMQDYQRRAYHYLAYGIDDMPGLLEGYAAYTRKYAEYARARANRTQIERHREAELKGQGVRYLKALFFDKLWQDLEHAYGQCLAAGWRGTKKTLTMMMKGEHPFGYIQS